VVPQRADLDGRERPYQRARKIHGEGGRKTTHPFDLPAHPAL